MEANETKRIGPRAYALAAARARYRDQDYLAAARLEHSGASASSTEAQAREFYARMAQDMTDAGRPDQKPGLCTLEDLFRYVDPDDLEQEVSGRVQRRNVYA